MISKLYIWPFFLNHFSSLHSKHTTHSKIRLKGCQKLERNKALDISLFIQCFWDYLLILLYLLYLVSLHILNFFLLLIGSFEYTFCLAAQFLESSVKNLTLYSFFRYGCWSKGDQCLHACKFSTFYQNCSKTIVLS